MSKDEELLMMYGACPECGGFLLDDDSEEDEDDEFDEEDLEDEEDEDDDDEEVEIP